MITFSHSMRYQPWGLFINFDWLVHLVECSNVLIYRRGNFLCHNWGCKTIYRPLSYPFKTLQKKALVTTCNPHSPLSLYFSGSELFEFIDCVKV